MIIAFQRNLGSNLLADMIVAGIEALDLVFGVSPIEGQANHMDE